MRALRWIAGAAVMASIFTVGTLAGLGGVVGEGAESATTVSLSARLDAAQEVPRPRARAGARGTFAAGLVRSGAGGKLSWRLTFRGLSGSAAASHIHFGRRGKAGPVAASLCGPCRSGARGTATVSAKTVTALLAGTAYVNVHTARNKAGEIRGQIVRSAVAPPPAPPPPTTTGTTTYEDPYP